MSWANRPRPDCFSWLFNKKEGGCFFFFILFGCFRLSWTLCKLQPWRGEAFLKTKTTPPFCAPGSLRKKSKWKSARSNAVMRPALQQAFRSSATLHIERDLPPSVSLESKNPSSHPLLLTLGRASLLLLTVLSAKQSLYCIQMPWLKMYLE